MVHTAVQHMKDQDSSQASVSLPSTNPSLALSQCWRAEDLLGGGNRFKQRALFYSPTFKAAKLIVKSAAEREGVSP